MIYSMTAFSRQQSQGEWGSLVCEMRSINHRYLEISIHLPETLRALEMPIRDLVRQHLKRGKVECVIRYQSNPGSKEELFSVNMLLAQALSQASEKIMAVLQHAAPISPTDILRFPGVLEPKEADLKELQAEVLHLLSKTLKDLLAARLREGEELKQLFLQRMDSIQNELVKVRERLPQVIKDQQDRLFKRLSEVKLELDTGRLEQEIVFFAQKIDVAEEIERTETHITEVRRILKEGGLAGRRLDFLLQELNREANTLGSKSADSMLTHSAVEMKVLIEQVREQVQNIE
ncbi:MAG: YicC family protein [Gammaproteobacteria bacterium]|nr:YicC family protein [Gammaproteobacteria bacterium]MCW5584332.1 YicC family protein [Gammaproteobacteria bacterium]